MKKLIIILSVALLYSCAETTSPVIEIYKRISSKTQPNSYCPISHLNFYHYYYILEEQIEFNTWEGSIEDTMKFNNDMAWASVDLKTWKINKEFISPTYVLKNAHTADFPIYFTIRDSLPKFSFFKDDNLNIEYDIESYPNVAPVTINNYTFKNVKCVTDTFQTKNYLHIRDYYFAKGIGLIKYSIRQTKFNTRTQKNEVIKLNAEILDFNIK